MGRTPTATSEARQRILDTADRLFYTEGVRAVGIDRVIAEAGVAKATLYAHFPSKDDLILAVLQFREAAVVAFFAESTARHRKRVKDPLRAFFAALKEWFASPGFRGCAFQNAAVELADPDHPGTAFVRGHKGRFHETLAGLVREAVGPAGDRVAPAVAVLVEGAIVTALIDRSPAAADVARDAAARLLASVTPG
jgi:AcrR family transcriptional regulator